MSSRFDSLPPLEPPHDKDTQSWFRLRQIFEEKYEALVRMKRDEDAEAVYHDQETLLDGIDNPDIMERMFTEGKLANPAATPVIEQTRDLYHCLMASIPTPEEESLATLRSIHQRLISFLRELERGGFVEYHMNLREVYEEIESYVVLSTRNEEAQRIINDIMRTISHLAQLMHKQNTRGR
jgi:hypothetical protein